MVALKLILMPSGGTISKLIDGSIDIAIRKNLFIKL